MWLVGELLISDVNKTEDDLSGLSDSLCDSTLKRTNAMRLTIRPVQSF